MQREEFMRQAIALALKSATSGEGGPFGAVVVKSGHIVAQGVNRVTSKKDPTAHAEVEAIREACRVLGTFQLTGCELYSSCEPCPMCLGAIYWARPDRFYFAASREDAAKAGFDDAMLYRELPLPSQERSLPGGELLRDESTAPFDAWRENPGRIPY